MEGIGLFSQVKRDRKQGNNLMLDQGRFRLEIRNNFSWKVFRHQKRLPMELVKLPSLEVFKGYVDEVLRGIIYWCTFSVR